MIRNGQASKEVHRKERSGEVALALLYATLLPPNPKPQHYKLGNSRKKPIYIYLIYKYPTITTAPQTPPQKPIQPPPPPQTPQNPLLLTPSPSPTTTLPGTVSPATALSTTPLTLSLSSSPLFLSSSSCAAAPAQSKLPAPPRPDLYLFTFPVGIEEFLSGIVGVGFGFVVGNVDEEEDGGEEEGSSEGLTQFPAPPRPVCAYSGCGC